MGTPPAPDLRHMTIQQLIDALAAGQVDSPLHRQATVMLQLRIAEQQAAAVHQQAVAAEQQAQAARAMVAPTRTLARFTIVLAFVAAVTLLATIVQVSATRQYVDVTNKLLHVQVEPNVKLDLTALGSDSVEVWNAGFDPVIDVRINPEIVAFTGATPGSRYRWNVGPGRENQNDWWRIARLSPDDPSPRKSLAELAERWKSQLIDKQRSGSTLIKNRQRAAIICRITYQRDVDKRQLFSTKIFTIDESGQRGDRLMYTSIDFWKWSPSSQIDQSFLEQLDRLSKAP